MRRSIFFISISTCYGCSSITKATGLRWENVIAWACDRLQEFHWRPEFLEDDPMDCHHRIEVPLRAGKKMKKRRELDALIASQSSSGKRANRRVPGGTNSQDKLLSVSTDDPEDYAWVRYFYATCCLHRYSHTRSSTRLAVFVSMYLNLPNWTFPANEYLKIHIHWEFIRTYMYVHAYMCLPPYKEW